MAGGSTAFPKELPEQAVTKAERLSARTGKLTERMKLRTPCRNRPGRSECGRGGDHYSAFSRLRHHDGEDRESVAAFRWFLGGGTAVQSAKVEDAPALPQLRRSLETGLSFIPNSLLRASLAVEGFAVAPSIPAGMVLYRGYTGFSFKGVFALSPSWLRGDRSCAFWAFGASASLARYTLTELAFMEYSAFIAPGVSISQGIVELRASLPLTVAFRGDAVAFAGGILFCLSRARHPRNGESK